MIYLLNGIRDSISGTTGALAAPLRSFHHEVAHLYRPTTHTWHSRSESYLKRTAEDLLMQVAEPGGVLVAHSQGCLQAWYMLKRWAEICRDPLFRVIYFIAPAMNRRGWDWQQFEFDRMRVVYNPDDLAIWLGSFTPFHPFGLAGVRGFKTADPRIAQRSDTSTNHGFWGHSHYFDRAHRWQTAREISDFVEHDVQRGGA